MATSPSSPVVRPNPTDPSAEPTRLDSSQAPTRPNRRRQRSVRVTVAVALLGVATVAVVLALPTQSPVWLSAAAVLSLVLGWAAARIVYSELIQSRIDNATDRAAQANAYRTLFAERADEHAEFTTAMTDRLAAREKAVAALEDDVVAAQKRAIEAEARVQRESRRAHDAEGRLTELRGKVQELEAAHQEAVERAEKLAAWDGFETVVDLMAWEQKLAEAVTTAQQAGQERKQA